MAQGEKEAQTVMQEPAMTKHGLWTRLGLLANRPRRMFNNLVRPGKVGSDMARRRGKCLQCGACCQMGARCWFLFYENGLAMCRVYNSRKSPNCRNFPMSEKDLAERDLVCPERKCGYSFEREAAT